MLKNHAVFLDRDGVLNRAVVRDGRPYPPKGLGELELLPGVLDALRMLKAAGFDLIVVTNQPDVARGTTERRAVDAIHAHMQSLLPVDQVLTCFHDDKDGCNCRKPKPGFLLQMQRERGIDLSRSFMVGDRWRDIETGIAAGCRTVFLDYGYAERNLAAQADHVCTTLLEAAVWIVAQH